MTWRTRDIESLSTGLLPEDLSRELNLPLWLSTVLHHRMKNWSDPSVEAAKRFLDPSLKNLPDPFSMNDMDQGADRLAEAIVQGETIAIYGDYDVDGTVGSALMRRFLRRLGVEPIVYQPDRQKEGYGVNISAMDLLAEKGAKLLLTIDCGITSVKEVERANELGMDVIICDHHEPKEILPPAYAVLDHKRADNTGPIQSLSGAGVAFYLAMATRSVLRDIGHFDPENGGQKEPDIRELLDLVALAAVADLVPLVDENRILVKAGLEKMKKNPNPGIRALLDVAGVKPDEVSAYHLGFILGPRINASGRLGSANGALELLSTDDLAQAQELAAHLDGVNAERMQLQSDVSDSALAQAADLIKKYGDDLPAFVLHTDEWHEGVIGIVASRVVEKYHRPTAMITFATHTGLGKGSVRGVSGMDMTGLLESCSELLAGFGGHKAAAGLSLKKENIEKFRETFAAKAGERALELTDGKSKILSRETIADIVLSDDSELSKESVEFLEKLAPFGMGNAEPVLMISGWKIAGMRTLKERHLKLQFTSPQNKSMEGFWANGVGRVTEQMESVDIACSAQINTFRNLNKVELKIKDIRATSN